MSKIRFSRLPLTISAYLKKVGYFSLIAVLVTPAISFAEPAYPFSSSTAISNTLLSTPNQPSLFAIMQAEFDIDRGNTQQGLGIYKNQAKLNDTAPVFERALGLSLQNELPEQSLTFANQWQQDNPEHIPALFYVTHLALKAHQYGLAGKKLSKILAIDPNADLSQILVGIYPTDREAQLELLNTLQKIDNKDNPSLLVLKSGLLLQLDDPKKALNAINKVLKKRPKVPAFLTLKADILQALEKNGESVDVVGFLEQARKTLPDNKSLFLYQTRYLLQHGKSSEAWQQLNAPKNIEFLADDEIKLLAGLVGIDLERYEDADNLLLELTHNPDYKDQAYYYLGISSERQLRNEDAVHFYGNVMQPNLVIQARKKQVAILTSQKRFDDAIASMIKLRKDFDQFTPQSYIMQASILESANKTPQALQLLTQASQQLPDNTNIMFAKVLLLPDEDNAGKLAVLNDLIKIAPNNVDYELEYAQTLVNLHQQSDDVENLLTPLINDREVGLRARQILAQQALHQDKNDQVVMLLSDNFDIIPDVISGLLLHQAYTELGNADQARRVDDILQNELNYNLAELDKTLNKIH